MVKFSLLVVDITYMFDVRQAGGILVARHTTQWSIPAITAEIFFCQKSVAKLVADYPDEMQGQLVGWNMFPPVNNRVFAAFLIMRAWLLSPCWGK